MTAKKETAAEKRKREMAERLQRAREASDGRNGDASDLKITTVAGMTGDKKPSSPTPPKSTQSEDIQPDKPAYYPTHRGRIDTDRRQKIQTILGPVSKSMVEFRLTEVDPRMCTAHPANRRNQKFLTESNPKVQELVQSIIESGGVREATKAVKNIHNVYELMDGSTRRIALILANELMEKQADTYFEEQGKTLVDLDTETKLGMYFDYFDRVNYCPLLPILIATDISPEDAAGFARTANEMRSNESPWELAMAVQGYKSRYPNEDHTQQALARALGVSRDKIKRAANYEGIPESLMLKFNAPDTLSESVAKHLINIVTKTAKLKNGFKEIIEHVNPDEADVYTSATTFKRDLDAYIKSLNLGGRPKKQSTYAGFERKGACDIRISQNRANPQKFKIDIEVDDLEKLKSLEKLLAEWGA